MESQICAFVQTIPGWLSLHEGQFLEKSARTTKQLSGVIVEIGCYCGKSTIWLAQGKETVYSIDPHAGDLGVAKTKPTFDAFRKNIKKAGVASRVIPIVSTSRAAVKRWKANIKLLFIDGLHDESHANEDFERWSPFVVPGGIIAMHDSFASHFGAQQVALERIVGAHGFSEIGVVGSIIYGVVGSPLGWERIVIAKNRIVIRLSIWLTEHRVLPQFLTFFLIHRLGKVLLLNRFTGNRL